jgi:membrane-associated phospholipid phosphatase
MLLHHGRSVRLTLVLLALAASIMLLVALEETRPVVQEVDEATLRLMERSRSTPLTWLGLALNVLGSAWVTTPVRVATSVFLIWGHRWWFLAMFVLAWAGSATTTTLLKLAYERPRPPGSLVQTSSFSFPSGHATAAAVTTTALVIVLVHPGPARRAWRMGAIVFTLLMGVSRAYLAAHWLSDAVAGVLLGSAFAVGSAVIVQWIRDRRAERMPRGTAVATDGAVPASGPLDASALEERRDQADSSAASASGSVTGRRQTKRSQT